GDDLPGRGVLDRDALAGPDDAVVGLGQVLLDRRHVPSPLRWLAARKTTPTAPPVQSAVRRGRGRAAPALVAALDRGDAERARGAVGGVGGGALEAVEHVQAVAHAP